MPIEYMMLQTVVRGQIGQKIDINITKTTSISYRNRRVHQCEKNLQENYKSSSVAEMGDRSHNRHGPKRWGSCCARFAQSCDPV